MDYYFDDDSCYYGNDEWQWAVPGYRLLDYNTDSTSSSSDSTYDSEHSFSCDLGARGESDDYDSISDIDDVDDIDRAVDSYRTSFDAYSDLLLADSLLVTSNKELSFKNFTDSVEPPSILESEKCLLPVTVLREHLALPLVPRLEAIIKYNKYCRHEEIPDCDWTILRQMIRDRDGEAILNWFQNKALSRKVQLSVEATSNSPLYQAAEVGSLPIFEFLLGKYFCYSETYHPLISAIDNGHAHIVKKLLDIGLELNSKDKSPLLHLAAESSTSASTDIIKLLLSHGADVNAVDASGVSALKEAVYNGRVDNAILLLQAGANVVHNGSEERPALHMAAVSSRHVRMLNLVFTKAPEIRTSLNHDEILGAVRAGRINIVRYFIQKNVPLTPRKAHLNLRYDLLYAASKLKNEVVRHLMIDILLGAGYIPNSSLMLHQTIIAEYGLHPYSTIHKRLRSVYKKIDDYFSCPQSLQLQACLQIRQTVGTRLPDAVKSLPVPRLIADYLLLKHL